MSGPCLHIMLLPPKMVDGIVCVNDCQNGIIIAKINLICLVLRAISNTSHSLYFGKWPFFFFPLILASTRLACHLVDD